MAFQKACSFKPEASASGKRQNENNLPKGHPWRSLYRAGNTTLDMEYDNMLYSQ